MAAMRDFAIVEALHEPERRAPPRRVGVRVQKRAEAVLGAPIARFKVPKRDVEIVEAPHELSQGFKAFTDWENRIRERFESLGGSAEAVQGSRREDSIRGILPLSLRRRDSTASPKGKGDPPVSVQQRCARPATAENSLSFSVLLSVLLFVLLFVLLARPAAAAILQP